MLPPYWVPPIEPQILADVSYHLPSRLAWLMTGASSRSNESYMRDSTMMEQLAASSDELDRALRTVSETWKLFRWDGKKNVYARVLAKKTEPSRAFKARVQRKVNLKLGIAWILRDLLEERRTDGKLVPRAALLAPHSLNQFAAQLGCHRISVSRVMGEVLAGGYFTRFNRQRQGNMPIYTLRDVDMVETTLDLKYERDERTLVR